MRVQHFMIALACLVAATHAASLEKRASAMNMLNNKQYWTRWDLPQQTVCPHGEVMSTLVSQHNNKKEDRVWHAECNTFPGEQESCYWSGFANDFDGPMNFQCPFNGFLAGMRSSHDDHKEDRRYSFYCCTYKSKCPFNCHTTDFLNAYDQSLGHKVPAEHYMRGISSVHDSGHEDRRWRVEQCPLIDC